MPVYQAMGCLVCTVDTFLKTNIGFEATKVNRLGFGLGIVVYAGNTCRCDGEFGHFCGWNIQGITQHTPSNLQMGNNDSGSSRCKQIQNFISCF
mmetsp:Transcript_39101/g.112947  ORF Transcript_39101/g.112947 Transcript_39101/m.112947 type:complete len:94 (-) Transcript_39101:329-610(-)